MLKFLMDLVRSPVNPDKASHTKFWSNMGMLAMTIVFIYWGFLGTLPEWYMWAYAAVVAAPQLISKLISLRWGLNFEAQNSKSDNKGEN